MPHLAIQVASINLEKQSQLFDLKIEMMSSPCRTGTNNEPLKQSVLLLNFLGDQTNTSHLDSTVSVTAILKFVFVVEIRKLVMELPRSKCKRYQAIAVVGYIYINVYNRPFPGDLVANSTAVHIGASVVHIVRCQRERCAATPHNAKLDWIA